MIERAELSALARSVKAVIRESLAAIGERIDTLEKRFTEIPAGPRGEKGEPGDSGPVGPKGESGESIRGEKGDSGVPGDPGARGDKGEIGLTGDPGQRGERGDKGDPGERGLPGLPGDKGERGEKGEQGEAGLTVVGEKGADGKDGRDGRDGIAVSGKDGRDGNDGRDALQIDPLPAIDPAKSYPRGTYAEYSGGTIRAFRNTVPITGTLQDAGWSVMCDGESVFEVVQAADLRTFTFKRTLTSGRTFQCTFKMPVVISRGIFKDGTEYSMGDSVVWDNSTWTCQVESTKAKPGTSPDWLMSARKGGEGKPGKDGARGIDGKDGKDWRPLGAGH